jgi:hypothetical protein
MARTPILHEEALLKFGAGRLAKLVIDEATRDPAFRKLATAALAATKGPKPVAAIIDKRLAGLERANSLVPCDKAKALADDIIATLAIITGKLAPVDPNSAIERLIRFLSTADRTLRADDSTGRLQEVYQNAGPALHSGDL